MGIFRLIFFPYFILRRLIFGKGVSSVGIPLQVLNNYRYDLEGPRQDGELLWVEGRPPFLVAFLLNLVGLSPRPSVKVNLKEVVFTYQTAFSLHHLVVPLEDITVADCRYEKPSWRLWLGVIIAVLILASRFLIPALRGAIYQAQYSMSYSILNIFYTILGPLESFYSFGFFPLIISAILLFTYWRSKRIVITFSTSNLDDRAGLAFSRTLQKDLNFEEMTRIFQLINRYIVQAHYARFDNPLSVKAISEMRMQDG